ncbi:MAG: hypothetical protein EA362_02330 [Saprospirales bacterium]|nr:MAG: hypothetical protein EA362_02330 [Saprospirales bacterium]
MRYINKLFFLFILGLLFSSCERDELTEVQAGLPTNVDAELILKQDNSGDLTIIPKAEGANHFIIDFGDGSELSDPIAAGGKVTHRYTEGEYQIRITARNIAGGEASATKTVNISFDPPENLDFTITRESGNPLGVIVTPTADKAIGFEVDFGESDEEDPQYILVGESAQYTYADIGTYTITVTAISGGEATISLSKEIDITDPLVLPIDFESPTVSYTFNNFGGGEGAGVPIVGNPDPNDVNPSPNVGSYTKVDGSEVWAGTSVLLDEDIDFSSTRAIAMDVYSPQAGIPVLFKVEQDGNPEVFAELTQNTSVANEWETLTFNLVDVDPSQSYSIIAIFFNFGTSGTGETYYFDNIRLTNPVELGLPLDFESGPTAYSFTEFGGSPVSIISNPDPSGINTSANVAELTKAPASETWAGAFIDLDVPIDLGISSTLTLKVWSPQADIPVLLKIENPETGAEVEVETQVPVAQEWVEIEFDLSDGSLAEDWTRVVFFFNFGTAGTGERYYFDDLDYVTNVDNDIVGTWVMANEDASLGVGPAIGDVSWWNCSGPCLSERACYFDDTYTFGADGSFVNGFGAGETWVEAWQGVPNDQCEDPVAPHNGSNPATYSLVGNSLTLNGEGAYIGLPKAMNVGELPNVPVPDQVTYNITFEGPTTMRLTIESGAGVFWQYKLVKQ